MPSIIFNEGYRQINSGGIRLTVDTIKIMLVNATVTPTGDEDNLSSFTSAEINVTNYSPGFGGTGRVTLTSGNMAFTADDANNYSYFDYTADITWNSLGSGATIRAGIIYKHTGTTDTDCIPIAYLQLGSDVATNGGNFTFQFNSSGIFRTAQI